MKKGEIMVRRKVLSINVHMILMLKEKVKGGKLSGRTDE